jgi:S1-C subfamily serine protease
MWLGVEFEPMTKELAESLALEKDSKDGSIGLVVSAVYPESPAERLGIQSGDVLLKIEEPGADEPTELRSSGDLMDLPFDIGDLDMPDGMDVLDFDFPSPPLWKSRDNVLTRLLEVIGDGEEIALTYLAGGTKKTTKFVFIEQAPPDFDSAPKVKDTDLGITVKAITYEVRHALKIADQLNPVVAAKVEEGEPASVARVREFDLITRVDDTQIDGPDSFKQVVDAARARKVQDGKATLRLTLQRLGKTRIADVTLE